MSRHKIIALALCLPLLSGAHWSEQNDADVAAGQAAFQAGDYARSVKEFRRALSGEGARARLHYNLGTALILLSGTRSDPAERGSELDQAIVSLRSANAKRGSTLRESVDYNLANAFLLRGRYSESISVYRRLLIQNPNHDDARYNLQLAMLAMRADSAGDSILAERLRTLAAPSGVERAAGTAAGAGNADENNEGPGGAKTDGGTSEGESAADGGPAAAATAEATTGGDDSQTSSSPTGASRAGADSNSDSDASKKPEASDFAQGSGPNASKALSLKKKLDALERRSAELRRASIYRKTNARVRHPNKKARDQ